MSTNWTQRIPRELGQCVFGDAVEGESSRDPVPDCEDAVYHAAMRAYMAILVALVVLLAFHENALAHSGGLDSLGCHHNRKLGGYHCHRGPLAGQSFRSKSEALDALRGARPPSTPKELPAARPSQGRAPVSITGRARVIDGDTIEIGGKRIRLYGIDAPESRQTCRVDAEEYRCGQEATSALVGKIGEQPVSCTGKDTDRYGRIVAVCWLAAEDLSAWMVWEGKALAYRKYSRDYVAHEDAARQAQRGLWRGEFQAPWEWRAARRGR